MNERTEAKIQALTNLINHTKTSEDERDAARRALARIRLGVLTTQGEDSQNDETYQRLYHQGAWQGSKYEQVKRMDLATIAKLMREDIKMSRKAGKRPAGATDLAIVDPIADAPVEIKVSIRSRYFSGGGAIDVAILNVPAEWGWTETEVDDNYSDGRMRRIATPALAAFKAAIEEIHRAYNYDNSDAQVDYFERHFWGSVQVAGNPHFLKSWEYAA